MRKPVLSDINGIPVKRTMNLFGDPMSWFSNYVSFDFFVDYKRQQLGTKEAWIKIILEPGDIVNEHNIQETAKQFIDWTLAGILWERYGFSFHFFFLQDNQQWSDTSEVEEWYTDGFWIIRKNTVSDIKQRIITNGGNDERLIGNKGLRLATSNLERFMSYGNALWPGDVDAIVFDNDKPSYILELRTQNYKLESCFRYSTTCDQRKYLSLQFLANELRVPIIALAFPTWNGARLIMVERIRNCIPVNSQTVDVSKVHSTIRRLIS